MKPSIRKEFNLKGLDCAHCAETLQNRLRELDPETSVTVNFAAGTLVLETARPERIEALLRQAAEVIEAVEPGIRITDRTVHPAVQRTLILVGLDCAHCADRIEKAVADLTGIQEARVDFVTHRLTVSFQRGADTDGLIAVIEQIVSDIEAGVRVVPEEAVPKAPESGEDRPLILRLAASALLFAIALFLPDGTVLRTGLFLTAYVIAGAEVLLLAFRNLIKGQMLDENFLMALATLGALGLREYPEAATVMIFYQTGELFQSLAVRKSRRSIQSLLDIRADETRLITEAGEQLVPTESVSPGARIVLRPGDRVPLDGVIEEGASTLDTSALTGESMPRDVAPGTEILSGSINLTGLLKMRVTRPYSESTVARILHLVENAASRKAPTEQFITRFARVYTPAVVAAAAALALFPPLLGYGPFSTWTYRALVFLVVSCPCALVVSIPLGFFGGIGAASRAGILVKGSNYLEALNRVDAVVFDKTGTLTEGRFTVAQVSPAPGLPEAELLKLAGLAETWSTHPIAACILAACPEPPDRSRILQTEELPGRGIRALLTDGTLLAGNPTLLAEAGIPIPAGLPEGSWVHIAWSGAYAGSIRISDTLRPDAQEALRRLKRLGIRQIALVTGDTAAAAAPVAEALGIPRVCSGLLPEGKVEAVEQLQRELPSDRKLLFAGDGINDAPVLARADVGVAMGGLGSEAAIEAADIVLMTDEPSKIADAIEIARFTRNIVVQNILIALGVKGLVLLLGAGGLATLWEAVFADVGVALIAVFNAMRVLNWKR